jgi:REP element-mobilizing transposase RayT
VPNCPHHVVKRGHNRKAVFLADQDYQYYLDNLREWKQELEIKTLCMVLDDQSYTHHCIARERCYDTVDSHEKGQW